MPRNIVESADANLLTVRTRILDPNQFPGGLLARAFIEYTIGYSRDDRPGVILKETRTYKLNDTGPNPESVPLITTVITPQERDDLVASLQALKAGAEAAAGF